MTFAIDDTDIPLPTEIRGQVVNATMIGLSLTTVPGLLLDVGRAAEIGWLPLNNVHVAVSLVLWAGTLARHRLPFAGRVAILLGNFFLLGTIGTATFGPVNGIPFFAAATIMCAVFFTFCWAMVTASCGVMVNAVLYFLFSRGVMTWPHIAPVTSLNAWAPFLAGFALMTIGPMVAITHYRQRVEEDKRRAQKQAWALRAYGQAALALATAKTSQEIVDSVCAALVSEESYILAFMAFGDETPEKIIRFVGKAGRATPYLDGFRPSWCGAYPEGRGATATAIRTGRPYVVRDVETDPAFAPWIDKARGHGIRSCVTVPFNRSGQSRGVIAVYASAPDAFGPQEIELFANLGNAVGFAFAAFEDRARLDVETIRLQRLIESAYSPIVSIDGQGQVVLFNRAAEKAFGYAPDEVLGRPLDMLLPEKDVHAHRAHVQNFVAGPESAQRTPPHREVFGKKKNGETFPIEVAITRVDTIEGRFSTAIINDLTERKRFEEKLIQSAKMEAFGQLTGGIAHDFNNLLSIVVAFTDVVAGTPHLGPVEAAAIDRIRRTCARGGDLVRRMMTLARRDQAPCARVNVCAVLEDLVAVIKGGLGKDISVAFQRCEPDLYATLDLAQLHTSILNLAFNARDAMPDGGRLTLSAARVEQQDGTRAIEIGVKDSGTGIAADIRDKIFEPFYTTKTAGKGTGLGLVMVKRFVEESDGDIFVESQTGLGTRFTLRIPEAEVVAA